MANLPLPDFDFPDFDIPPPSMDFDLPSFDGLDMPPPAPAQPLPAPTPGLVRDFSLPPTDDFTFDPQPLDLALLTPAPVVAPAPKTEAKNTGLSIPSQQTAVGSATINALEKKNATLEQALAKVSKELNDAKHFEYDLIQARKDLQDNAAKLETMSGLSAQLEEAKKALKNAETKASTADAELKKVKEEKVKMSAEMADLKKNQPKTASGSAGAGGLKKIETKKDKDARLAKEAAEAEEKKRIEEEAEAEKLRIEAEAAAALQAKLEAEQKLVDDLRAAFENIKRQKDDIALLTTELQKTKASLQAETQQLAEANSVKAKITEELNSTQAENQSKAEIISKLLNDIEEGKIILESGFEMKEKIIALEAENKQLSEASQKVMSDMQSTLSELQSTKHNLSQTEKKLITTAETLVTTDASLKTMQERFSTLESTHISIVEVLKSTESKLDSAQATSRSNTIELSASLQSTQERLTAAESALNPVQNKLATTELALKTTKEALESSENSLRLTEKKLAATATDMSQTIAELTERIATMDIASEKAQTQAVITMLTKDLKLAQDSLASLEEKHAQLEKTLQATQDTLKGLQQKSHDDLAVQNAVIINLKSELRANEEIITELNADVTEKDILIAKLRADVEGSASEIAAKEALMFSVLEKYKTTHELLDAERAQTDMDKLTIDNLATDLQSMAMGKSLSIESYEEKLRVCTEMMIEKDRNMTEQRQINHNQEVALDIKTRDIAKLKSEVENRSISLRDATAQFESLLSEKNVLETKLKLRDDVVKDLNDTIKKLQDINSSGIFPSAQTPQGCNCALLKPQLFAFIKLSIATEATLEGRVVDIHDERVLAAEKARRIRYDESASASHFYALEKKTLSILASILEDTVTALAEASRKKMSSEQKLNSELKLKTQWMDELMTNLAAAQNELAELKLAGASEDKVSKKITLEKSRLKAVRTEAKLVEQVLKNEVEILREYVIAAQEAFSQVTGDVARPSIIAKAKRMLSKITPWLGVNVAKSIFDSVDQTGVTIVTIKSGGPADEAGLRVGMLVERVNDQETKFNAQFSRICANFQAGDRARFQIVDKAKNIVKHIDVQVRSRELNFKYITELKRMASGVLREHDQDMLSQIQWHQDNREARASSPNFRVREDHSESLDRERDMEKDEESDPNDYEVVDKRPHPQPVARRESPRRRANREDYDPNSLISPRKKTGKKKMSSKKQESPRARSPFKLHTPKASRSPKAKSPRSKSPARVTDRLNERNLQSPRIPRPVDRPRVTGGAFRPIQRNERELGRLPGWPVSVAETNY